MLMSLLITVFRMLVLPVEFEDRTFTQTRWQLQTELAEVQRYFDRQYGGERTFRFELAQTAALPRPVAWYGANRPEQRDHRLGEAVREACSRAAAGSADFSGFDNDGDGSVEVVCLLYPGPGEDNGGGENDIWPQLGLLSANGGSRLVLGGKRIDRFIACPAGRPGIFAHEFGHVLGLCDLYDTDGTASGGATRGLWGLSLMDEGCKAARIPDFTAVEYEQLGIGRCDTLTTGSCTLLPLQQGRRYVKLLTDRDDECFLFEARDGGLLVYHLDRSDAPAGYCDRLDDELTARERWEYGAVNDNPAHPCARLLPADPGATSVAGARFPRPGGTSLGSDSPAPLRGWSGRSTGMALTGIRTEADGAVSFEVIEPVVLTDLAVYQDAAVLRWKADESLEPLGYEIAWSDGAEESRRALAADAVSCTIEGLRPQTIYRVSLQVRGTDGERFSVDERFVTKVYRSGTYPYIYLNGATRHADGSFPAGSKLTLRVFNATDVEEVRWTFDGERLVPEADGRNTLTRSGMLRAQIFHSDGSSESIFKEITVR